MGSGIKLKAAPLLALAIGAGVLAGCDDVNTVARPDAPQVLTGAQLPALVGTDPGDIVAFRWRRDGDAGSWQQMPVQVDERKVVGFGQQPANNTLETTIIPAGGTIDTVADGFYADDDGTTVEQCWGDPDFLGAHGTSYVSPIPNTDPAQGTAAPFRSITSTRFLPPGATAAQAATWAGTVRQPLQVTVTPWPGG